VRAEGVGMKYRVHGKREIGSSNWEQEEFSGKDEYVCKMKLTVAFVHDAFDSDQTAVHQGSHFSRDGAWNMSDLRLPDVLHLYRIAVLFDCQ